MESSNANRLFPLDNSSYMIGQAHCQSRPYRRR